MQTSNVLLLCPSELLQSSVVMQQTFIVTLQSIEAILQLREIALDDTSICHHVHKRTHAAQKRSSQNAQTQNDIIAKVVEDNGLDI